MQQPSINYCPSYTIFIGVATSQHPDGPFRFKRSFYPDGNETHDQVGTYITIIRMTDSKTSFRCECLLRCMPFQYRCTYIHVGLMVTLMVDVIKMLKFYVLSYSHSFFFL